jgi:Catechol dioxygenase N terminus
MNVFLGTPFPYFSLRCRSVTTEEWRSGIEFLTRMGETSITRGRQFTQFSDVFGVTALVERINNPRVGNSTESTLLGPFFTEDAPDRA